MHLKKDQRSQEGQRSQETTNFVVFLLNSKNTSKLCTPVSSFWAIFKNSKTVFGSLRKIFKLVFGPLLF